MARHYVHFSADLAKSFMAVEGFVGFAMAVAQGFNLFHFLIVFFDAGKKLKQPGFEHIIGKRCF
ncbi:MAG TPA: hypothetical protein VHA06_05570 [Candidatus Angelobacter sp.]|nr:hypothetical protein [Candidatus Angelobacter sp.]